MEHKRVEHALLGPATYAGVTVGGNTVIAPDRFQKDDGLGIVFHVLDVAEEVVDLETPKEVRELMALAYAEAKSERATKIRAELKWLIQDIRYLLSQIAETVTDTIDAVRENRRRLKELFADMKAAKKELTDKYNAGVRF